ncbi:unnamed protein product, partial [Brenthis ino]
MATFYIFVLATVICSVRSLPVDTESSSSSTSTGLQLLVKNSTDTADYHLTPYVSELEQMDERITEELEAILPYINFLFDTLFDRSSDDEDECIDDMVIQLVPEKSLPKKDEDTTEPAIAP